MCGFGKWGKILIFCFLVIGSTIACGPDEDDGKLQGIPESSKSPKNETKKTKAKKKTSTKPKKTTNKTSIDLDQFALPEDGVSNVNNDGITSPNNTNQNSDGFSKVVQNGPQISREGKLEPIQSDPSEDDNRIDSKDTESGSGIIEIVPIEVTKVPGVSVVGP